MTTMKAVRIRSFGGPEVLELTDIEMPQPGDEEVLIRVRAASVNPVDYKIRSGAYPVVKQDQLPKVLGRDVAGEVARCGRAVRNFKEGDTVYAMLDGGPGGYAEYVTVRAELVAPKPAVLDYVRPQPCPSPDSRPGRASSITAVFRPASAC
ncbi:MAG TPA: alcohol dehydrogenase catalytic domain-containing protein [Steroidobacteraceae bacterium]|nr:alcohol dehydrogenase catalytic domain-containing protein [Steroidobacteraceae bacterium]